MLDHRKTTDSMLVALCLLVALLPMVIGCGGCSSGGGSAGNLSEAEIEERRKASLENDMEEAPRPPTPPPAIAVKPPAPPPTPLTPPPTTRAQGEEDGDGTTPSPTLVAKPVRSGDVAKPGCSARPENVANWKRADYYSAQRDSDPRLIDAVRHIEKHFSDNEKAAELLAKLLESSDKRPATSTSDDDGVSPAGATTAMPLTKAIVEALVANRTATAKQAIERILEHSINTNDQLAAAAVFKTLLGHPNVENEELLVRLLTTTNGQDLDSATVGVRDKVRSATISIIASSASESFRIRLAKAMIAPETPQSAYDQLWDCLKQPRPENSAAQMVIFQSDRPDTKTLESLAQSFTVQRAEVVGRLMGLRPSRQQEGDLRQDANIANPYRAAERFWTPDGCVAIQQRLSMLTTLADGARLVWLASTIPNPSMRVTLLRTLERHWDQGPKGLHASDPATRLIREPGFVVLLKTLPHRDAAKGAPGKDLARLSAGDPDADSPDGSASGRAGALSSPRSAKTAKMEVKRRQEQTAQEWAEFSHAEVAALCQRLHAVAKGKQAGAGGVEWNADDVNLPFKPHPRATIVAAYQLNWPEDLKGKLDSAPWLRVRYVRIEQKAQPGRVLAYYRRQLPNAAERPIPNGLWLDTLETLKEEQKSRSIDVFLTKASASVPGLLDQEQELTVEILTVECTALVAKDSSL